MIDFSQFTLNNQGVTDINKVLFTTAFVESDLFSTCTRQSGIKNGQILDYVDNIGEVGVAGRKCDPEYGSVAVKGLEKKWELTEWNVAKKICYKEIENTIAKWSLNTGTSKDDLTSTEFWNKIMMPLLNKALTDMYWRIAWFNDTQAKHISESGTITNSVDLSLLKINDGLWKRLLAVTAENGAQRTTIAANTESTYAAQKAGIKAAGVALETIDDLLSNADSRIAANGGKIMLTRSFYQALRRDYALRYKDTIPFMEVADGVKLPTYDGIPLQEIPEWDTLITKYENDGTKLNNPHRAVFANPDNLFVGTSATDMFAEFDTTFDKVSRHNYLYAASDAGTLVGEDALVQIAI